MERGEKKISPRTAVLLNLALAWRSHGGMEFCSFMRSVKIKSS